MTTGLAAGVPKRITAAAATLTRAAQVAGSTAGGWVDGSIALEYQMAAD